MRSAGDAPASPAWHAGILLLDDDRREKLTAGGALPKGGSASVRTEQRTNTAAASFEAAPAGFSRRMFRCLRAHLPKKPSEEGRNPGPHVTGSHGPMLLDRARKGRFPWLGNLTSTSRMIAWICHRICAKTGGPPFVVWLPVANRALLPVAAGGGAVFIRPLGMKIEKIGICLLRMKPERKGV